MKIKYDLNSAMYSDSNKNETLQILKLIRSENVGIKTFYSLIDLFGSAKIALENIESMSIKGGRNKPIKIYSDEEVEKEVNEIEKIDGYFVSYKDKKYPKLLSQINDSPPILSYIGNSELLNNEKIIAVVGTRNASLMGKTLASKITKDLYYNNFTIVSGLARGIDAAAHEASIDKTIAVIAGGLGHIYPSENRDLYYKIAKEGLIVSELKVGSIPMAQNFPQRNRIISGLSLGVLVVEATTKSGSLITARFAIEQNREVFAIPGFPMDPRSNGTNKLIKQGAHIVECFSDIVENLPEYISFIKSYSENQINNDVNGVNERQNKFINIEQNVTVEMRKKVFNSLSSIPVSLDLLYRELDIPIQILHTIILELELAGKICRNQGNKISLIYCFMNLVIVESPSKGKTINKYLGKDYKVLASYGHIVDLPSKNGSVLPEKNFLMKYEANPKSERHIKEICSFAKKSDNIYLATDPDREGEAIAWHVAEIIKERKSLKKGCNIKRIAFNEITKKSVENAIQHPRDLDQNLIDAQQARRALDYLVGFTLSPLLWRKVPGCKSAGRVQSVALRLISERECEIERFKEQEYWSILVNLLNTGSEKFSAKLVAVDSKKLDKFDIPCKEEAEKLENIIKISFFEVTKIEKKKQKRNPYAPFTTSTLQQEAARKLGFSTKKTMQVAQKLYEGVDIGSETTALITYMRTDGVSIAKEAIEEIRAYINSEYGDKYLPQKERVYQTKTKNAQEAHEAIRPIDVNQAPSKLKNKINEDLYELYELIWKRSVACQMESAVLDTVSVQISSNNNMEFKTTGSIIAFDGFYKVYREGIDDKPKEDEEDNENKLLPPLKVGEKLSLTAVLPKQHFTEPPPRYSEASLVKKLEELGIGRPSTYASIISVLQDRGYVVLEKKRFIPHSKGRVVTAFLENYFKKYVEYDFTAELENELDEVASGSKKWIKLLSDFWGGFDSNIKKVSEFKMSDILAKLEEILSDQLFKENQSRKCYSCSNGRLNLKFGKYGAFISCSNYPECNYTKQISEDKDQENTDNAEVSSNVTNQIIGSMDDKNIYLKKGPYGWYLQLGNPTEVDKKDVKRSPIPAGFKLDSINEELAKKFLSLPLVIGKLEDEEIMGNIGRYGPYVKCGKVIASIPRDKDLFSISKDEAIGLINKKLDSSVRSHKRK